MAVLNTKLMGNLNGTISINDNNNSIDWRMQWTCVVAELLVLLPCRFFLECNSTCLLLFFSPLNMSYRKVKWQGNGIGEQKYLYLFSVGGDFNYIEKKWGSREKKLNDMGNTTMEYCEWMKQISIVLPSHARYLWMSHCQYYDHRTSFILFLVERKPELQYFG